jgi:hypothetical protein
LVRLNESSFLTGQYILYGPEHFAWKRASKIGAVRPIGVRLNGRIVYLAEERRKFVLTGPYIFVWNRASNIGAVRLHGRTLYLAEERRVDALVVDWVQGVSLEPDVIRALPCQTERARSSESHAARFGAMQSASVPADVP